MDIYSNEFADTALYLSPFMVWKAYLSQSIEPLSLKEVAKAIGLNYCYLCKVVNNKASISLDRFVSFYRFLYSNLIFQKYFM